MRKVTLILILLTFEYIAQYEAASVSTDLSFSRRKRDAEAYDADNFDQINTNEVPGNVDKNKNILDKAEDYVNKSNEIAQRTQGISKDIKSIYDNLKHAYEDLKLLQENIREHAKNLKNKFWKSDAKEQENYA